MRWRDALARELDAAARARESNEPARAFAHLERAHILSQRHTWLHVRVHAAMWRWAWWQADLRELAGQVPRMAAALVFSRVWVPAGNTGGARVSAFRPMAVPEDLAAVLAERE
jgi:hypothetical protein